MTEAIRNLRRREIRIPFLIIFTNSLFVRWSGPIVIVFYAVEIFEKVGLSTSNQYLSAIISASFSVLGGVVGIFIIRLMPRVRLAMISMTLLSVSMFTLPWGLYSTSRSFTRVTSWTLYPSAAWPSTCSSMVPVSLPWVKCSQRQES